LRSLGVAGPGVPVPGWPSSCWPPVLPIGRPACAPAVGRGCRARRAEN